MAGQKISAMSLVAAVTDDMKFPTDQSDGGGGNLAATAEQIADFVGAPAGDFWSLEGTSSFVDAVIIDADSHNLNLDNISIMEIDTSEFTLTSLTTIDLVTTIGAINIQSGSDLLLYGTDINIIGDSSLIGDVSTIGLHSFNRTTRGNININGGIGDVSSPQDGDIWYDITRGKLRNRENSVSLDLNVVFVDTVSVSSAEILASNTPKTIIAAPGSGKFIQVLAIDVLYTYGGATYAGGGTGYFFKYNNAGTALNVAGFSVAHTADRAMRCEIIDDTFGQATASVVNQPVTISTSGNYTTGNGTFKVYIAYRIVTI